MRKRSRTLIDRPLQLESNSAGDELQKISNISISLCRQSGSISPISIQAIIAVHDFLRMLKTEEDQKIAEYFIVVPKNRNINEKYTRGQKSLQIQLCDQQKIVVNSLSQILQDIQSKQNTKQFTSQNQREGKGFQDLQIYEILKQCTSLKKQKISSFSIVHGSQIFEPKTTFQAHKIDRKSFFIFLEQIKKDEDEPVQSHSLSLEIKKLCISSQKQIKPVVIESKPNFKKKNSIDILNNFNFKNNQRSDGESPQFNMKGKLLRLIPKKKKNQPIDQLQKYKNDSPQKIVKLFENCTQQMVIETNENISQNDNESNSTTHFQFKQFTLKTQELQYKTIIQPPKISIDQDNDFQFGEEMLILDDDQYDTDDKDEWLDGKKAVDLTACFALNKSKMMCPIPLVQLELDDFGIDIENEQEFEISF